MNIDKPHNRICILTEEDAQNFTVGIEYACATRRHRHYSRRKVEEMVKDGELKWLGKHRRVATYNQARTWMKVYRRNRYGETVSCNMQLVRGGGGF